MSRLIATLQRALDLICFETRPPSGADAAAHSLYREV